MKIATLNVHSIGGKKIDQLCKIINDEKLDLLCFQEISLRSATLIQFQLLNKHKKKFNFKIANLKGLSVVLFTKYHIKSSKELKIQIDGIEDRVAIQCSIFIPSISKTIVVIGTHLDHQDETIRLKQLEIINTEFRLGKTDVFMGDLNALWKPDYAEKELTEIQSVRKKNNWESAKFDLLTRLTSWFKFDHVTHRTSRFQTRIDYILIGKKIRHTVINNNIIPTINQHISDHNMVVQNVSFR